MVNEADFGRVLAEFWADGPDRRHRQGTGTHSPMRCRTLLGDELRIGGEGDEVDKLEWDIKLYLVLNGANHDAAVTAWGSKGYYDYVRPISMIRWMGGLGQSSDPDEPAFDPNGLPLSEGLVEVISVASSSGWGATCTPC